jgi:hypothetical protein
MVAVDRRRSFLKRACGSLEVWKTSFLPRSHSPDFPRFPQHPHICLCKRAGLCEKRVQSRVNQGPQATPSSTGDELSTPSTAPNFSEEIEAAIFDSRPGSFAPWPSHCWMLRHGHRHFISFRLSFANRLRERRSEF